MILSKTEVLAKAKIQIKGRQALHIVRTFYEVQPDKAMTFELRSIMGLHYAGDANLPHWKSKWDDMVRNQRCPLTDMQLESIYFEKFRGSLDLKLDVEQYGRAPLDHPDRCYKYLSGGTDTSIREKRQTQNQASLIASAGGPPAKRTGAPGTQQGQTDDPAKDSPKPSKGKGKDGKGGKGEGKDGKPFIQK